MTTTPMYHQDLLEANDLAKDVYAAVEDAEMCRSRALVEAALVAVARLKAKLDLTLVHMDVEGNHAETTTL